MIKPEFFSDEKIGKLPLGARLLFIGLWNFSDDCGVHILNFRLILGEIFPNDEKIREVQIKKWVLSLAELNFIKILDYNGGKFIKIVNWDKHQKVPNPSEKQWIPQDALETLISEKLVANETLVLKEKEKEKEKEKTHPLSPLEDILLKWNGFAKITNLQSIVKLSDKRQKAVINRLSEKEFDLKKIFNQIQSSPFLCGKNERGWKVDFDFVFCSANNYLKILEGKYNGGANQKRSRGSVDFNKFKEEYLASGSEEQEKT